MSNRFKTNNRSNFAAITDEEIQTLLGVPNAGVAHSKEWGPVAVTTLSKEERLEERRRAARAKAAEETAKEDD